MNNNVTAIIADDEPLLRYQLNKMLADIWPELDIIAQCKNGTNALNIIMKKQPDVAFLDIRMPELDGMTLAKELVSSDKQPIIIFVTAYDEYAVHAFEANAIDYLLKPLNEKRLEQSIQKIKQRLHHNNTDESAHAIETVFEQIQALSPVKPKSYLQWIRVPNGENIELIHCSDILFLKAEDKYVSLYKQSDTHPDIYLLRGSLRKLLSQLDPDKFWQIHRSIVVNVDAIEKIKRNCTGKMHVLISGHSLQVSRSMQNKFLPDVFS